MVGWGMDAKTLGRRNSVTPSEARRLAAPHWDNLTDAEVQNRLDNARRIVRVLVWESNHARRTVR